MDINEIEKIVLFSCLKMEKVRINDFGVASIL